MAEIQIQLRLRDGTTIPATIQRNVHDETCWLHIIADGIDETSTSTDYFESFASIRRKLVQEGIFPLCYASSRNIWPSGMMRDWGGLKAYKLEIGVSGGELVDIFSAGPDIDLVTPEEQKAFAWEWYSLHQTKK